MIPYKDLKGITLIDIACGECNHLLSGDASCVFPMCHDAHHIILLRTLLVFNGPLDMGTDAQDLRVPL